MHHDWIIKTAILSEQNRHGAAIVINDGSANRRRDFWYEGPWKNTKNTEAKAFIDLAMYLLSFGALPHIQLDTHTIDFHKWLTDGASGKTTLAERELRERAFALMLSLQTKTEVLVIPPAPKGMARSVTKRERSAGSAAVRRVKQIKDRPEFKAIDEFPDLMLVDGAVDNYPDEEPHAFDLTQDQEYAYSKLWEFFYEGKQGRTMTLSGSAGTGKTTVISMFAGDLQRRGFRVSLTAPTNKAAQVLTNMSKRQCRTIHKLLGLRMGVNTDDPANPKEELIKENWMKSEFPSFHLVIIDEASMISRKLRSGKDGIGPNIERSRTKVIFLGDACQLPPVGEPNSVVFSERNQVQINEIVRQGKNNPLLNVLVNMRETLDQNTALARETRIEDGKGISFCFDADEFLRRAVQMCGVQKESGNRQYCRLLAWTNDTVDWYNEFIRSKLIGSNLKYFQKGEIVVNNTPILDTDGETLSYTSQELVVLEHEELEDEFGIRIVKYITEDVYSGDPIVVPVLHQKGIIGFQRMMDNLADIAKSAIDPKERKEAWDRYYRRRSMYGKISPGYALTVHRSQGSTFDHVLVDEKNINLNSRVVERNQCKYVALSRARFTATIL